MSHSWSNLDGLVVLGIVGEGEADQPQQLHLFGGVESPLKHDSPQQLLDVLRLAVSFLVLHKDSFRNLASEAVALLPTENPGTFFGCKSFAAPLIPILTKARAACEGPEMERFSFSRDIFDRLIATLKGVSDLGAEDEQRFDVITTCAMTMVGPQHLVREALKTLEAQAKQVQATSLNSFASQEGLQVTTCANGHVVLVKDGTLTDTGVPFTEEMHKALGLRFMSPPKEGHPCTAAKDDEEGDAENSASSSDGAEASS
jgi:hypothetical protein